MATFAVERFEQRAEAFARARALREWQHQAGLRADRGLSALYEEDFPELTSLELYADLRGSAFEDARRKQALERFLAAALLEGRTRHLSEQAARFTAGATAHRPDTEEEIPWRSAPVRWTLLAGALPRHAVQEGWRAAAGAGLNRTLARWQEALLRELPGLGAQDWRGLWCERHPCGGEQPNRLAETLLALSMDVYAHVLGVYFAQLDLPLDDAWTADADWAFRAPRFDASFPSKSLLPTVVWALRDLGLELSEQTGLTLDLDERAAKAPGAWCIPVDVPRDVRVACRLVGGYQDFQAALRGVGQALHLLHADASLPFAERGLGDASTTLGYGLLLEGLVRDRVWLRERLQLTSSQDERIVAHLAWLYRVRRAAALTLYEERLWDAGATSSPAAAYVDILTEALHVRHFPEEHLLPLLGGPWGALRAATWLRAELFAAQLRHYLRREYDEEWFRDRHAARFLVQELWRPGRRHTAEELLGFMGYEGFDAGILWAEITEVLQSV